MDTFELKLRKQTTTEITSLQLP